MTFTWLKTNMNPRIFFSNMFIARYYCLCNISMVSPILGGECHPKYIKIPVTRHSPAPLSCVWLPRWANRCFEARRQSHQWSPTSLTGLPAPQIEYVWGVQWRVKDVESLLVGWSNTEKSSVFWQTWRVSYFWVANLENSENSGKNASRLGSGPKRTSTRQRACRMLRWPRVFKDILILAFVFGQSHIYSRMTTTMQLS